MADLALLGGRVLLWRPQGGSTAYATASNWVDQATGNVVATSPGVNDQITFDGKSSGNCLVTVSTSCRQIVMRSGFVRYSLSPVDCTLTVVGGGSTITTGAAQGGVATGGIAAGGSLGTINLSGGTCTYTGQLLNAVSGGTTPLTVNVQNNCSVIFGGDLQLMNAQVVLTSGSLTLQRSNTTFLRTGTPAGSIAVGAGTFLNVFAEMAGSLPITGAGNVALHPGSFLEVGNTITMTGGTFKVCHLADGIVQSSAFISLTNVASQIGNRTGLSQARLEFLDNGGISVDRGSVEFVLLGSSRELCGQIRSAGLCFLGGGAVMQAYTIGPTVAPGYHQYAVLSSEVGLGGEAFQNAYTATGIVVPGGDWSVFVEGSENIPLSAFLYGTK